MEPSIRDAMIAVGLCPNCLEIPQMDDEAPLSHCSCGTGEDYGERPLQKLQLLKRELGLAHTER